MLIVFDANKKLILSLVVIVINLIKEYFDLKNCFQLWGVKKSNNLKKRILFTAFILFKVMSYI